MTTQFMDPTSDLFVLDAFIIHQPHYLVGVNDKINTIKIRCNEGAITVFYE